MPPAKAQVLERQLMGGNETEHDGEWVDYVNTWLELKKRDNTLNALFEHWILGKAASAAEPRWSVVRDVLGWVE